MAASIAFLSFFNKLCLLLRAGHSRRVGPSGRAGLDRCLRAGRETEVIGHLALFPVHKKQMNSLCQNIFYRLLTDF